MTTMKYVFGMLAILLMAGLLFAQSPVINQQNLKESQVVITPADQDGKIINISVLVFNPAVSVGGTTSQDAMANWTAQCGGNITCVQQLAQQATAASRGYQMNITPLQNAHFVVLVFNPQGSFYTGQWTPVSGCEDVVADQVGTAYRPDSTGTMVPYTYYFGQCDLNTAIATGTANTTGRVRYDFRVTYVPQPDQQVSSSSAEYSYTSSQVSPSSAFTQSIRDFVAAVSSSGGAGLGGGTLPCVGVFLILGLLMASLYFSGKSPISLLDITTPRLPTPKGVTASGQILAPWGYSEMKNAANQKMTAAAKAMSESANVLQRQNPDSGRLAAQASRLSGGTPQDRQVAGNLATLGRAVGFSSGQLAPLVNRLPYHYGDAEHKLVAQILDAAKAKGGREALLAMMTQDYLYGQAMLKQLDVLSGHPDVGMTSPVQKKVEMTLGKFVGANRYAIVGGATMSGVGSMFRTGRVMGRMTKAIVEETPNVARVTARTTMEMLGGKNIVEELEARGRTSPTAAWMAGQLQKHPSEVVIGAMYPINEKMAHLYKSLRHEAGGDAMEYVIKQGYKAMGLKLNISQEELMEMSYKDMDLLQRVGYKPTAALAAFEEEMRRVLSNATMSQQDKLSALTKLAESHGATIDHQMVNFMRRLDAIEARAEPEHVKLLLLNQALEEQSRIRMAANTGGRISPDSYVCHVGGPSLRGGDVADKMLFGTLRYDATHGMLRGGIKEELLSMQNNMINRGLGIIDHSKAGSVEGAMALLPEFMRNPTEIKALSERARGNFVQLLDTPEAKKMFEEYSAARGGRKSMNNASISEIVDFMFGGNIPRTGATDPKTGRKIWWTAGEELGLPQNAALVDVKRAWDVDISARKMHQIAPWVEAKFTRGNVAAYDAAIEAQVKRLPGYASMTGEQEAQAAKRIWYNNEMMKDLESRFNGQFSQNAYGTTRETMKFYGGIMAGFLERAIDEKKGHAYAQELAFLDRMDLSNPKDLGRFKDLLQRHSKEYNEVVARPMTYDDIVKSKKAIVLLQEGGYAYYKKGMVLSDMDRVMAGQAALRDEKGQLRPFIPEDVAVTFGSRDDLTAQYHKLRMTKDPSEWQSFVQTASKWAKEGGYSYERERVLGAVLWEYGTKTHDYESFWKNSAITVEAKRQVTPVAPSVLRMFGAEAPGLMKAVEPFRNLAMAGGDMISKVAYKAGGPVLTTSYTGAAVAAAYSAHSFDLTRRIYAGEGLETLTEKEANAFRAYAATHGAFTQARQWTFDRSPFGYSTSHGTNAADAAMFAHGPGLTFKQSDYIGAYMDKKTLWNFNAFYGWPMDISRRLIAPYATAVSSAQKEMVGRAGRWDTTGDQYRMLHHTEPRVRNALQSFTNPFSLSNSKLARKLNVFQGAAQHTQTGGEDVMLGLSAMTQDITLYRKGILVNARYGDVNPRETYYDPRVVKHLDAPMAYELMKDPTFKYQKQIQDDANAMTVRRTAAAETLAIKRSQELMSFNSLQTPQGKFYSPVHFALQTLRVPDMISKHVARTKYGVSSPSVGDSMKRSVNSMATGLKRFTSPGQMAWETRCAKCGAKNGRYSKCTSCGATLW